MSYQESSSQCNQTLMCGHPDTPTYIIYCSLIFLYLIFANLITFLCIKVIRFSLIKTPRSLIHFLLLYLYCIGMLIYCLGIFIQYSDQFYFAMQNIPGVFFQGSLLIYLSSWYSILTLGLNFQFYCKTEHLQPRQNQSAESILFFLFIIVLFQSYTLSCQLLGCRRAHRKSKEQIEIRIMSYLFIVSFLLISLAYLIVTMKLLVDLRTHFSLLYKELKCQILLCSLTQSIVLVVRVIYALISQQTNWPEEKDSKYSELFIRVVCELLPLSISVTIYQKAANRYVRESEPSAFPVQRTNLRLGGWQSLRDKTTIFLALPEEQN